MKKILTYISVMGMAALAVISCQTVPEDNSHTDVVVPAPSVTITVSKVSDNSATITIAPDGAANYFSYVVDASDEAEELDAEALYANKYSSVANGIVKYDAEKSKSVEVELTDLEANVTYQVYAVAGSTTGVVGEIAVKSFITSDSGLPEAIDFARDGNIYQVLFSENITYNESIPVTAKYYAANAIEVDDSGDEPVLTYDGEQGDADVDVLVSGAVAQFTVTLDGENPLPNGAYYAINIPEGAFTDAVGNKLPTVPIVTGLTSSGTLGFAGIYGRVPASTFDLVVDEEKTLALPSESYFLFPLPEDVVLFDYGTTPEATLTISGTSGNASYSTAYKLAVNSDWGFAGSVNSAIVFYPSGILPNGGDDVTIEIAEGSLVDIYGNTNAKLEVTYLYSFNYTMDDITGTYTFDGATNYVTDHTEGIVIAPYTGEDAEDGDVVIYNFLSNTHTYEDLATYEHLDPTVFYGNVNLDSGILTVGFDAIGTAEDSAVGVPAGTYVVAASIVDNSWSDFELYVPASGTITISTPIYIVLWGLGWWDHIDNGTFTRTSTEYTIPEVPAIAPASAKVSLGSFNSVNSAR